MYIYPGAKYMNSDSIEVGELEEPMVYFSRYLDEDFFVSMAQYMNIKEEATTGKYLHVGKKEINFGVLVL